MWEEPSKAVAKLPADQLVWGFPQAGGEFDNEDVLKGSLLGNVYIGKFGNEKTAREATVVNLFNSDGFQIQEVNDYRSWLLGQFILNAALALEHLKYERGFTSVEEMKSTKF